MMLVGEQPGDREDLAGRPFVGPASRLLDEALREAGFDRGRVYVTNVVKHFTWEPRGKGRIDKKPNGREVAAWRRWLDREIALIRPRGILCLGATAARAPTEQDCEREMRRFVADLERFAAAVHSTKKAPTRAANGTRSRTDLP